MGSLETTVGLAVICGLVLYLIKKKYSYWKDMGVPFDAPSIPFGNIKGLGKEWHQSMIMSILYHKLKSFGTPFVGIYFYFSPVVLVTDLEFVKTILVKDAANFPDRGSYYNEKDGETLKFIEGQSPIIISCRPIVGTSLRH